MEEIQHSHITVGELKLHIAEIGTVTAIQIKGLRKQSLWLHRLRTTNLPDPVFEIWYSWRHQMVAVAKAGYRAIALDYRGYGLSEQPPEPEKTTLTEFSEDVIGLLDALGINKVFLVTKDFGAIIVSMVAVLYPDRVSGFITLGVPFILPGLGNIEADELPKGFYIPRWVEPGRAEADFGRFDVKTVIRKIYIMFSGSELQVASDDQEIMDLIPPNTPLPPWFSEEDLSVYANLYENSGFRTALQVPYRTMNKPIVGIEDANVKLPALLIMGEKDYVLKFPGMENYIRSGMVKKLVPELDIVFMPQGTHFVQEQMPEEVNELIISFLNKHSIHSIQ